MQDAAKELETACRTAASVDETDARLAAVTSVLLPVIRSLSGLDRNDSAAGGVEQDPETLHALLARLRELIEDYDAEAADVAAACSWVQG